MLYNKNIEIEMDLYNRMQFCISLMMKMTTIIIIIIIIINNINNILHININYINNTNL